MTTLIGSRDPERGEHAAAALRRDGIDAVALTVDIESESSVLDAATRVADEYGHLDILVNNAGLLPEATADDATTPVDVDLFTRTFETNVFGAVMMIQQFVPLLLLAPTGRIVNVSTTMGSLSDQADPASPLLQGRVARVSSIEGGPELGHDRRREDDRGHTGQDHVGLSRLGYRPISAVRRTGPRHRSALTRPPTSWWRWPASPTTSNRGSS